MGIKAQNQVTILDITDAYSVILSNENQTFRENAYDAGVPSGTTTTTTVYSYRGSTNVYSYLSAPVTETIGGQTHTWIAKSTEADQDLQLTINIPAGLKTSGSITIPIELYETSNTSGDPLVTVYKTFSYSVARYGSTGTPATIYELEYTGTLFNFDNATGAFLNPSSITITASSQTGTNAKQAYTGGTITVTPYTATGTAGTPQTHSTSIVITPSRTDGQPDYLYYIATLTINNNEVDRQTIGINRQGANGENAYNIDITSSNGFTFKNTTVSTVLTAHVYSGGTELTQSDLNALNMQINWYEGASTTAVSSGMTRTYTSQAVTDVLNVTAKLEDKPSN